MANQKKPKEIEVERLKIIRRMLYLCEMDLKLPVRDPQRLQIDAAMTGYRLQLAQLDAEEE